MWSVSHCIMFSDRTTPQVRSILSKRPLTRTMRSKAGSTRVVTILRALAGMYSSVHTSLQLDGTHTVPRQLRLLRVAVSRRVCFRRVSPRTDQIDHDLDHLGQIDQIYHDLDNLDPIPPLCYRVQDTCSTDPAQEPCPRPCRLYGSHPAT